VMPKESKRYKYKTVTLPEPLMEEIKQFIDDHPELGYGSVTEFIKEASRGQMKEYYLIMKMKMK